MLAFILANCGDPENGEIATTNNAIINGTPTTDEQYNAVVSIKFKEKGLVCSNEVALEATTALKEFEENRCSEIENNGTSDYETEIVYQSEDISLTCYDLEVCMNAVPCDLNLKDAVEKHKENGCKNKTRNNYLEEPVYQSEDISLTCYDLANMIKARWNGGCTGIF